MSGKSENTKTYTAAQVEDMRRRGEGKTDWDMSQKEAMRRRHADEEAPRPYPGWKNTISVKMPEPKAQITLRIDSDMLDWFREQGRGYQTLINAVLRGYYESQRQGTKTKELERMD